MPVQHPRLVRVIVNGAFRGQRVTGQQRYAGEVVAALEQLPLPDGWRLEERRAPPWAARSRVLSWLWVQSLILSPPDSILLSLTSRAPVLARNHVMAIHDNFVLTHPEWYRPLYRWSHAVLQRWHLRSAASLIAVSEPVAQEVRRMRGRDDVVVVPNAPAAPFALQREEAAVGDRVRDAASGGAYFLAVGTLDPRKNLRRLLNAYGALPAATRAAHRLLLAGDVGQVFAGGDEVSAPEGAQHLGYVTDDELAHLYRHALATVFVSLDEGFGLPAVEALSCGARLIASDIPVFHWVCGDRATYVDPLSEEAISASLRSAIDTAGDAAAQIDDRDRERFTWERSAQALLAALGAPVPTGAPR